MTMEFILNLAWAVCSLGLVCLWLRKGVSDAHSRTVQVLALAMVVLLLLPVISLSDDLVAAQGPAESDSCLRRALHSDELHPSVVPASLTLPEPVGMALAVSGSLQEVAQADTVAPTSALLDRSLDSRPPPRV